MQPEKRERHPAGHHRLQVTGLRHVVRVEREDRCGDDRRVDAPRERAREHEHRCAGKDERREEDRVVAEDRVAGRPLDRRGEHRDAEQMLGERERVVERIEDWHLPEAAKAVAEPIGVPGENPGVQQRVAPLERNGVRRGRDQPPVHRGCGERQSDDHDQQVSRSA
ncbi:MAG: hypothetical protein DMG01_08475 [Acidobacteria bacterium]|nr:MAG: hypothetical protein DMG01_08475 [Acidobacteriota bacterium]